VEQGDAKSAAIAPASIVANETRDQLMRGLDVEYPGYGFAGHKGYITDDQVAAVIEIDGLSPAHRESVQCKAYAAYCSSQAAWFAAGVLDLRHLERCTVSSCPPRARSTVLSPGPGKRIVKFRDFTTVPRGVTAANRV
jgi:hypothetical protein